MPIVEVKNVSKTFSSKKGAVRAVQDVSFEIKKGEIFGLLGPNGAGKTTLVKTSCGLIIPERGDVHILNQSVLRKRKEVLKEMSAVLEGNRNIYWYLSPYENMKYFGRLKGIDGDILEERAQYYLNLFSLTGRKDDPVSTFSLGMQQKTALACALISNPRILLLDEPTLGLDVHSKRDIIKYLMEIKKNKCSILLTTHQMDVAEKLCDKIGIIKDGKLLITGSVRDLSKYFDEHIYQLTVNSVSEEVIATLKKSFAISYDNQKISVHTHDIAEIYEVIAELKIYDVELMGMESTRSLEECFVKFVDDAT